MDVDIRKLGLSDFGYLVEINGRKFCFANESEADEYISAILEDSQTKE